MANSFAEGFLRSLSVQSSKLDSVMPEAVSFFLEEVRPQLRAHAREHCSAFLEEPAEHDVTREEQSVQQFALFEEHTAQFERLMLAFLKERGVALEEFVAKVKQAEDLATLQTKLGSPQPRGEHTRFMDLLRAVDEYPAFLEMMREEARQLSQSLLDSDSAVPPAAPTPRQEEGPGDNPPTPGQEEGPGVAALMSEAVTFFLHAVQPRLNAFLKAHVGHFGREDEWRRVQREWGNADAGSDEQSLEQFALFKEYIAIFETMMAGFLSKHGLSVEAFVGECKAVEEAQSKLPMAEHTVESFVDVVGVMDDYDEWLAFMRQGSEWVHAAMEEGDDDD